jgi:hypothetical protein
MAMTRSSSVSRRPARRAPWTTPWSPKYQTSVALSTLHGFPGNDFLEVRVDGAFHLLPEALPGLEGTNKAVPQQILVKGLMGALLDNTGESGDVRFEVTGVALLVNNVGIFAPVGILETSYELWHRLVSVNLGAALFFTRFASQQMIQQGEGGRIVNVGLRIGTLGRRSPPVRQHQSGDRWPHQEQRVGIGKIRH